MSGWWWWWCAQNLQTLAQKLDAFARGWTDMRGREGRVGTWSEGQGLILKDREGQGGIWVDKEGGTRTGREGHGQMYRRKA